MPKHCCALDAAAYFCGYVLEMALKACICRRLREKEYPEDALGGKFKTHRIDDLLLLAGLRNAVSLANESKLANWSVVSKWTPEWRYRTAGVNARETAEDMIRILRQEVLPWLKSRW